MTKFVVVKTKKKYKMGNILYTIALILFVIWGISYLGFNQSGIIHILLVIALVVVVVRLIQGPRNY
jgi:hypothetical protein